MNIVHTSVSGYNNIYPILRIDSIVITDNHDYISLISPTRFWGDTLPPTISSVNRHFLINFCSVPPAIVISCYQLLLKRNVQNVDLRYKPCRSQSTSQGINRIFLFLTFFNLINNILYLTR